MKYYGKSEKVLTDMLAMFESGQVPKALARVFIKRKDGTPCRAWSWANQMLTALAGHDDARGYRQWEQVGRNVIKGSKAFYILGPCFAKKKGKDSKGEDKDEQFLVGFRSIPVFGYSQTEGDEQVPSPRRERCC